MRDDSFRTQYRAEVHIREEHSSHRGHHDEGERGAPQGHQARSGSARASHRIDPQVGSSRKDRSEATSRPSSHLADHRTLGRDSQAGSGQTRFANPRGSQGFRGHHDDGDSADDRCFRQSQCLRTTSPIRAQGTRLRGSEDAGQNCEGSARGRGDHGRCSDLARHNPGAIRGESRRHQGR